MSSAAILGGTGAIGVATARLLLAAGWQVTLTGRDRAHLPAELSARGVRFVPADGHDATMLGNVIGGGVDLLVDCVCFTAGHARELLPFAGVATSTVLMSSKAVYVDDRGRHVNSDDPPQFPVPITEAQPTMAPGDGDYDSREGYGANKVAAERVLLDSGLPVSVLRASKVHGAWSRRPREWMFVKRVLDGRRVVLLADHGAGVDHTTAAANVAALVETVAAKPGARILNAADPDAPSALQIARVVARHLDRSCDEVLLDGAAGPDLGPHPWQAAHPIVLDTGAALELGYEPAGDYAATVADEIDWLVAAARGGPGADLLPGPDDWLFARMFDYRAEDTYLAALPLT